MKRKAVIVFEDDGKNISTEINSQINTTQLLGLLEQLKFTLIAEELSKNNKDETL